MYIGVSALLIALFISEIGTDRSNLWLAVAGYVLVLFPMGYLTAALFGSSSSDDASWEISFALYL